MKTKFDATDRSEAKGNTKPNDKTTLDTKRSTPWPVMEEDSFVTKILSNEVRDATFAAFSSEESQSTAEEQCNSSELLFHRLKQEHNEHHAVSLMMADVVSLHRAGQEFMRRAMNANHPERYVNCATKCFAHEARLIDLSRKLQGKGQQKITVQHQNVNVEAGGRAAIANFGNGAPADNQESQNQRPLQLTRSDEEPINGDFTQRETVLTKVANKK